MPNRKVNRSRKVNNTRKVNRTRKVVRTNKKVNRSRKVSGRSKKMVGGKDPKPSRTGIGRGPQSRKTVMGHWTGQPTGRQIRRQGAFRGPQSGRQPMKRPGVTSSAELRRIITAQEQNRTAATPGRTSINLTNRRQVEKLYRRGLGFGSRVTSNTFREKAGFISV